MEYMLISVRCLPVELNGIKSDSTRLDDFNVSTLSFAPP